ncbi:CarD family transcriptional regulator, partial [Hydrogenophaga intermedia]|uniref:CarD family transcriptional regulator n=1 Tax=Hydrogenophaga intermedia TaxID=65786 RepID=UPI0025596961
NSRVVLVHEGHGPAQRMVEVLREHDVPVRWAESLDSEPERGLVHVTTATLDHGFVDEALCLAVLTGDDLSGQRASTKDMRKMPTRRKRQIDPLELKPGDFVVHEQHGVGRYVEMKQREVQGATREYLVLEYG